MIPEYIMFKKIFKTLGSLIKLHPIHSSSLNRRFEVIHEDEVFLILPFSSGIMVFEEIHKEKISKVKNNIF